LERSLKNIKMVVAYEGTAYAGFQLQINGPTIQGEIEKAILKITGEPIHILGAGRTDAGVHAWGQVVNFKSATTIPLSKFKKALNSVLPRDIVIRIVTEVAPDFHAQHSAISKTYIYRLYHSNERPLFERNLVYYYPYPLQVNKMNEVLPYIVGEHDFKSFQASGSLIQTTIRKVNHCRLDVTGMEIRIIINANGFLYHMVRNIAGTLIQIGGGQINGADFQKIMEAKDRKRAGPTAPAQGLCLQEVIYST
jgi:tRNA pseudouridine38-40 synthase